MSFVEFFNDFVNEGFVNHSTVKYRAMGATNKVFRILLGGIKNLSDSIINSAEYNIINVYYKRAFDYASHWQDLEGYQYKLENQVLPVLRNAIQTIRERKPNIETLWTWYVLFCAGFVTAKLKKNSGFNLTVAEDDSLFLFLPQEIENKYNNGEIGRDECINKYNGLAFCGGHICVKKQGGLKGSWNSITRKIIVYLPWLKFSSNKSNSRIYNSSAENRIHYIINVYERLTNKNYFKEFVSQLDTQLKPIIAHELTHAWQAKRRYHRKEHTYVGHDREKLSYFVPTYNQIENEMIMNDIPYIVSEEEREARRSSAQLLFKKGYGDYIDCVCQSDTRPGETWKQTKKNNIRETNHSIYQILTWYYYFFEVPQDKLFQKDLENHTNKTRNGVKYTGSYKQYMNDYQRFFQGDFYYNPDEVKVIAKRFSTILHLFSRALTNGKIKNSQPLIDFKNKFDKDSKSSLFYLKTYYENDNIVEEAKEALKKACSE